MTTRLLLSLCISTFIATALSASTVISLSDAELNELLQFLFSQLNGSTLISITLLESLGLNTASVISLLQNLGYTILW
jgi:hypothetical protein